MSHRCLDFTSDFHMYISGLSVEFACMLAMYIRTMCLPCALVCCFPPAVASAFTRSMLVCTYAKQFCVYYVWLLLVLFMLPF